MNGERFAAAEAFLRTRPGFAGVVVRDRRTGAVWRNEHAETLIWACSTPKLAMAVDLLLRSDTGAVELGAEDRSLIHAMLHTSHDAAATTLWYRHGGEEFARRFPAYGMTDMRLTDQHRRYWGWIRTTADDLDRLMS